MALIEDILGYFGNASPVLVSGGGLAFTALLIHLLSKPAERIGLIDRPGGRKTHEGLVPLTGGLAIYGGFVFASSCGTGIVSPILLLGMGLVLVVGLIDDLYGLSARFRLVAEICAALIMVVWGGKMIHDLGDIVGTGSLRLGLFAIPFTVLCTVGFINAFNMSDGIDGLASGCAITAMSWFIVATWLAGQPINPKEWVLLAAILGFAAYNVRHPLRKKASAFLGDSGSMLLGFALSWVAIQMVEGGPNRILSPIAVAWVLALPVIDTVRLMLQRGLRGGNPFVADREHLHHILLRKNLTPGQTSWLLVGINGVLGAIGVMSHHLGVPDSWLTVGFIGIFAMHYRLTTYGCRLDQADSAIQPSTVSESLNALSVRHCLPKTAELPMEVSPTSGDIGGSRDGRLRHH
ncbi:MraY family glycosyltransferase [Methylococcus capsulatus]|uniref:UDP-GlcNAc:undecaprenyl-phosphate/decaprenyl-phosphate GlcNAc-1-phosphate transferase n=1 Tax=Methylococcus capsulatus TaxID=414 RepID=A0AA35V127_METCP|nr:MraY family glycosyltransferase [Methylococcus capsulatus]QXP88136.1 undecaprenyl/decaprenyl-phosphate alpha-N-acetylglucosaminyl 1-phosphate transferase [Methylococcus capsulatus]QXP94856.1 undecaprenyl/decaprenyl-phosphate alpha-N-acetylglucosaminyl 1-phosphate transferase [Methylococcus capsulatus]UQN13168.1 undecaprenyl/decaprenyl-phosphate alpha-N-acetylglucosaminyl 1-phosphate transferase [Methylococcus capsulatus]CAI8724786.1 UDP-GlcNAc:undecaprenyl-phosphate/decaprenyl-phosphate GlcN